MNIQAKEQYMETLGGHYLKENTNGRQKQKNKFLLWCLNI